MYQLFPWVFFLQFLFLTYAVVWAIFSVSLLPFLTFSFAYYAHTKQPDSPTDVVGCVLYTPLPAPAPAPTCKRLKKRDHIQCSPLSGVWSGEGGVYRVLLLPLWRYRSCFTDLVFVILLTSGDIFAGSALALGQITVRELVAFMHATVMSQQSKREW